MKKVLFVSAIVILSACSSPDGVKITANDTPKGIPSEPVAESIAYGIVKAQSIDPNNVEFDDASAKYAAMNDSSYVFTGLARMPDKQGLKAPKNYNVVIKWLGGDAMNKDSWKLEDCKISSPNGI